MTISEREAEALKTMLEGLEPELKQLAPHERGFVEDQIVRWDKYERSIFMSPKQWGWLKALYERVTGNTPPGEEAPEDEPEERDYEPDDEIPF